MAHSEKYFLSTLCDLTFKSLPSGEGKGVFWVDASYSLGRTGQMILILTRPLVGITFSLDQKNIVETLTSFNYREKFY